MDLGKCGARADSIRGVNCGDSTSRISAEDNLESMSFAVSSKLPRYLLLLGVDLPVVLRDARPLSPEGSTRSAGLMPLMSSAQGAVVLAGV